MRIDYSQTIAAAIAVTTALRSWGEADAALALAITQATTEGHPDAGTLAATRSDLRRELSYLSLTALRILAQEQPHALVASLREAQAIVDAGLIDVPH